MELLNDKKFIGISLIFFLFLALIYVYESYAGLLLIAALIFFGSISLMWKEPHIKLAGLAFLVLLAIINILLNGVQFGIDFAGGTRIPVILDHPVDETTMGELVQTIKTRASSLGLSEVKVRAVGDNQINIEIPTSNEESIAFIESTLSQKGVYQGIIDGKTAVSGENIYSTSIRALTGTELTRSRADWGVSFNLDREGAEQFAHAAKGKADYPVYMFLDRPGDAALFYERSAFRSYLLSDSGEKEAIKALEEALMHEDGNIAIYITDDMNETNPMPLTNKTKALISQRANESIKQELKERGFVVVELSEEEIAPSFSRTRSGVLIVNMLEGAGLLSAPLLSSDVTTGVPSYGYLITGPTKATDSVGKAIEAQQREKSMISILKGGSLPVQLSLGSRTSLPASLGSESLRLSMVAIVLALLVISVLIGVRYQNVKATLPIVLISLAELIILVSILGRFTIDLAAMAGIIAAIGVGVDAQIIITDEILKKGSGKIAEKIDLAFGIIKTNAIVAISAMIPLFFSGIVEVIGFALSTIIGACLGYMLTRPAYAAIVEKIIESERTATEQQ